MKIGFMLHLRNKHQRLHPFLMYCCHLFFSVCLFLFISASPCFHFSISSHLCCFLLSPTCLLVFSLACLFVISSISATPTQLLSSSITTQRWFSFWVCVCACVFVRDRDSEEDRVRQCVSVFLLSFVFHLFYGRFMFTLRWEWVRRKTETIVECGLPPEGCLMDSKCKINFTSSLFTMSQHTLNTLNKANKLVV